MGGYHRIRCLERVRAYQRETITGYIPSIEVVTQARRPLVIIAEVPGTF